MPSFGTRHLVLSFMLVFQLTPAAAFGARIRVPQDFPTIQGAVDAASNGDTILVDQGTYVEDVTISSPLHLVGLQGASATTIKDPGTSGTIIFIDSPGPGSVSGFSLAGNPVNLDFGSGVACITRDWDISDCLIENNAFGIDVYSAKRMRITGNTIRFNRIAIGLGDSSVVSKNLILDNEDGIRHVGARNSEILNNVVANSFWAIYTGGGSAALVQNNVVVATGGSNAGSQQTGINFTSNLSNYAVAINNIVAHCGRAGFDSQVRREGFPPRYSIRYNVSFR